MSKARAKARRQQKRGKHSQSRWQPQWIFGAIIGCGLLILVAFFYLLAGREDRALAERSTFSATNTDSGTAMTAPSASATLAALPLPTPPTLSPGPADACRRHPRFASRLGFNERSVLSSSAPSIKGLVMIQPAQADTPERVYQDPSWEDAGYLGHMSFDPIGNVYLFPSPRENLIDNPPEEQNTLYRVDTNSAVMTPFLTLTTELPLSPANPFGLMGTTYDCDTHSLYASTVAGSTASEEVGKLVRIDLQAEAVVAELQGIDPFGLTVLNEIESTTDVAPGSGSTSASQLTAESIEKRLYFGAARVPEVYSIALNSTGDFVGQPQLELALPNPSLKPWRLVWDTNGDLIIRAIPFDFNLMATSERIEVPFRFRRDETGLWQWIE